jgi:hypothetical protein
MAFWDGRPVEENSGLDFDQNPDAPQRIDLVGRV